MPYIKLLTAPLIIIAGLALLTACGGGAAPTSDNNNNNDPCVTNPYDATCTNPTEAQRVTFCRDTDRTTDTKTTDCAPTVRIVCTDNAFDNLCTNRTRLQAEAFCGDPTKTTPTKDADCEDTIATACMNIRHTLCDNIQKYIDLREEADSKCFMRTGSKAECDEEVRIATCDADEFATGCVEQRYIDERKVACTGDKTATRCIPTVELICGANGDIFDDFCTGLTGISNMRRMGCESGSRQRREREECEPTILRICAGSIFDPYCDGLLAYQTQRESFCAAGEPDRGETICMPTIARVCGADGDPFDPFCTGIAGLEELQNARCEMNPVAACFATAGFVSGLTKNPPTVPGIDITGRYRIINLADTNDGVAFFASGVDDNRKFFTGMFSTTDLGAPLDSDLGAEWKGRFSAVNNTTSAPFDTDFTLTVDFSTTTIYALIPSGVRDLFYEIDGSFALATGLLSGSIEYGRYMGSGKLEPPPSESTDIYISGTLKGSIGQEGAVGAFYGSTTTIAREDARSETFQLVGGFAVAQPRACIALNNCVDVTTTAWTGSFAMGETPPAVPSSPTENEFLAILATTASSATNVIPTTLFIQDIDGDTTDGVAFFREKNAYYAGILADVDLGEPITAPFANASWAGKISTVARNSRGKIDYQATLTNFDFVLDIAFDGTDGGTIDALFTRIGRYYSIDGTFDDKGIIEGTVTYGSTTGTGEARAIDTESDTYSPGTLSGIIGRDSALGAFISDNGNVNAGSAATSFAGGFVARPRIAAIDDVTELANYASWVEGASPRSFLDPSETFQLLQSHATEDRLILSLSTNANTTAKKLSDARYNGESLVGTASEPNFINDGFAYFVESSKFYAGILSDTNMGAPLTQAPAVANWIGEIYSVSNAYVLPTASDPISSDLTLTIGFANGMGTISGTSTLASVNNNFGLDSVLTYTLSSGTFDTRGVMTGDIEVNVNPKTDEGDLDERRTAIRTGNFSGLIGARGAVGVFAASSFAGGFFAVPRSFAVDTDVSYGDWDDVITTAVATPSTPLANEFLTGSDGTGATSVNVINFNNAVNVDTTFGGDVEEGDVNDGFQIFANTGTGNPTNFYAGILTTTNLGGPIVEVADAVWQGHLYAARLEGAGGYEQAQFVLDFDFAMKTINGADIPARDAGGVALADGVATYGFTAVWDARGVFAGTIARTVATVDSDGTLTGIIGAEGAVGVFVSETTAPVGYAGGFVVNPNARWIVRYSDWTEDTSPVTIDGTHPASNQFLTTTGDDLGLSSPLTTKNLNLDTAEFDDTDLGGDAADGIGYEAYLAGNTNVFVSGIYATTDLGAALTAETAKGTWNGSVAVGKFTGVTPSFAIHDFTLEVLFDTSTVNSGAIGDTDITFTGTFNPRGVITGTTASTTNGAGVMQGLIGEQGAVGVFHSTTTGLYGGGFVARRTPPASN